VRDAVEAAEARGRAAEAGRGDGERERLAATAARAEAVREPASLSLSLPHTPGCDGSRLPRRPGAHEVPFVRRCERPTTSHAARLAPQPGGGPPGSIYSGHLYYSLLLSTAYAASGTVQETFAWY
jgi:hypothetical protein